MPNPIHADPKDSQGQILEDRVSVAPYNFVPLPEAVLLSVPESGCAPGYEQHDRYDPGLLTGWIDLGIETKTPLYIRCAPDTSEAADEEPRTNPARQHFFHRGDPSSPVIPGSSLRGMTRSLVEIMASGSFAAGWFSDRQLVYRAVGDRSSLGLKYREQMLGPNKGGIAGPRFDYPSPQLKAGYLRQDGRHWKIRPAQRFPAGPSGEGFVHVEYAAANCDTNGAPAGGSTRLLVEIGVRPAVRSQFLSTDGVILDAARIASDADVSVNMPQPGFQQAVLVRTGHLDGKHMHCAIYPPETNDENELVIPREIWEQYVDDAEQVRSKRVLGQRRHLYRGLEPLFYLEDAEGLVYFGSTMMFRVRYDSSVSRFVPEALQRKGTIDIAGAMFGTLDGQKSIKSRVFFEDALLDGKESHPFLDGGQLRTPYILGSPKPTAFQHYLVQPTVTRPGRTAVAAGAESKYLLNYHHPEPGPHRLQDMNLADIAKTNGTIIRGYKRYWHGERDLFREQLAKPNEKQYTIIRPVKAGISFTGRVRFENLSKVELGALLTALDLPATKAHHLGMGKPRGMGSVRISVFLSIVNPANRYASLFDLGGELSSGLGNAGDTATTGDLCRTAFANAVIDHHNASSTPALAANASLWQIPRLKDLSALMEFERQPTADSIGYSRQDTDMFKWWRERNVLPTPGLVARHQAAAQKAKPVKVVLTTWANCQVKLFGTVLKAENKAQGNLATASGEALALIREKFAVHIQDSETLFKKAKTLTLTVVVSRADKGFTIVELKMP